MKLFRSIQGFIFSFGFDMLARRPHPYYIGWCDPISFEWEANITNEAGWIRTPFIISPSKIEEPKSGLIIVYQSDYIIALHYCASPLVWGYTPYRPEQALREGIIKSPEAFVEELELVTA